MPYPISAQPVSGLNSIQAPDSHHDPEPSSILMDQCLDQKQGMVQCLRTESGLIDTLLQEVSRPDSRYHSKGLYGMHLSNHSETLRTLVLKFKTGDASQVDIPITEIKQDSPGVEDSVEAIERMHRALEIHRTYETGANTQPLMVGPDSQRIKIAAELRQWSVEYIQKNPSLSQTDLEYFLFELLSPPISRILGPALCQSLSRSICAYVKQFQSITGHTGHPAHPTPTDQSRIKLNHQGLGRVKWGGQKKRVDFGLGTRASTIHPPPKNRGVEPLVPGDPELLNLRHAINQAMAPHPNPVDPLIEWGKALLPHVSPEPVDVDGQVHESAHVLTFELALKVASDKTGVSLQQLRHALTEWRVLTWFESLQASNAVSSPLEDAKWTVLSLLAKTPRGLEACKSQLGIQWELTERQRQLLHVLSICAERMELENGRTPSLANLLHHSTQHEGVLEHACLGAVAALQGHDESSEAVQEHAWAINAVRNGLYSTEIGSDFDLIAKRLGKSKVWMDRAVAKNRLREILTPYHGKTPFHALKLGYRLRAPAPAAPTGPASAPIDGQRSRENLLSSLHSATDQLQGASRVKLSSGGVAGFGTKGISGTVSQLLSGFMLRVRGDIRIAKQNTANLELALPAYNLELMLYSQSSMSGQAGGGIAVGPIFGPVQLSAGTDAVAYNRESSHAQGVVLRIPRVRGQEASMKQSMKDILEEVFSDTPLADPHQKLKNILGKNPNLTVAKIGDLTEKKTKHEWTLEAGVAVDTGVLKVSALAGTGIEYQSSQKKHFKDGNGAMQVQRNFGGQALRGHAGAKLNLGYAAWSGAFKLNGATLEALACSKDFMTAGRRLRHEVVRNNQRLSAASFYEIEHSSVEDFTQSIMKNLSVWVDAKAQSLGISLEDAQGLILNFLNSLSEKHSSNYSYAQRFELKPACAEYLDQLETLLTLTHTMKDSRFTPYSERLRQQIQDILMSPDSYAPSSFRVFDRDEKMQLNGPHLSLRLQKLKQTEGVYVADRMM